MELIFVSSSIRIVIIVDNWMEKMGIIKPTIKESMMAKIINMISLGWYVNIL